MRSRNIKPAFFKNESLGALPFECRLLFQGLWCLADREGRLENRPMRIKAEIFPYDSVDVRKCIGSLSDAGLVVAYTVGEGSYLMIPKFTQHQHPHKQEPPSRIPKCSEQVRKNIGSPPAESLLLNPESPLLNSDSNTISPEPKKASASGPFEVPEILKDMKLYREDRKLCQKLPILIDEWRRAYPDVDIQAEILRAHAWELSNHIKKNRVRYLSAWCSRQQDKPKGGSDYARKSVSNHVRLEVADSARQSAYAD